MTVLGVVVTTWLGVLAACGGGSGRDEPDPEPDPQPPAPDVLEAPRDIRVENAARWGRCTLSWTPPPHRVDAYEVSASVTDWVFADGEQHGGLAPADSIQAELNFSKEGGELTRARIQIRSHLGDRVSDFSPPVTCVLPPYGPGDLAAMIEDTGIRVNWSNFSSVATTIELEKSELDGTGAPVGWSMLATVPAKREPFGSSFLDPVVAIGKAYAYRVTLVRDSDRSVSGQMASLQLGSRLTTGTIDLPQAATAVTDGNGHYAFANPGITTSDIKFAWGNGAPWSTSPAIPGYGYSPFVKLDAAGLPHAVYGKTATTGVGTVITHGWSNGTQWLEEPIAQRALYSTSITPALRFDVDAAGIPAIVWSVGDQKFEAAVKVGGAWVVSSLDSVVPKDSLSFMTYNVFTDQAGGAHVLVATATVISHLERKVGLWTREILPLNSADIRTGYSPLVGAGRDPEHLVICLETPSTDFWAMQGACVRKTPAGWGTLEPLGALPQYSGSLYGWLAMSPDGNRVAALYQGSGSHLYRSDLGGRWTETVINPLAGPALGFDAAGKLFVLSGMGGFSGPPTVGEYRFEHEP